jgi:hypothetical protein
MAAPTLSSLKTKATEYRKDEEVFLRRYANRTWSRNWFVLYRGELFDAKALWAAAHHPPMMSVDLNTRDARSGFALFPEFELVSKQSADAIKKMYNEGQRRTREIVYFVRNQQLVTDAKRVHGIHCMACDFDFQKQYGARGAGYIEMHHLDQLALDTERNSTVNDVVVLCANCHRMIERRTPHLSLAKLRGLVRKKYV